MSCVLPPYAGAIHAVAERMRALLPRRDLDLEVGLRFSDRKTATLFIVARAGGKELRYTVASGQYMAFRAEALDAALDKAVGRIMEELFPGDVVASNGFRGVRYWTWGEKRLQELSDG